MTEEEKDILQDKVIRDEANYFESNQHKALLIEDADYKATFQFKEGIARAAAKAFVEKALETPVFPFVKESTADTATITSRVIPTSSDKSKWRLSVYAIAATIFIAAVSTFFLADFRSANEFVTAELDNGYKWQGMGLSSSGSSRSSAVNWQAAFENGNYEVVAKELRWLSVKTEDSLKLEAEKTLIFIKKQEEVNSDFDTDSMESELFSIKGKIRTIQNTEPSLLELRYALAISKLYGGTDIRSADFGQHEFKWVLGENKLIDSLGLKVDGVNWFYALSLYNAKDCDSAIEILNVVIEDNRSDFRRKAKKLKRKMERECDLNKPTQ